MNGNEFSIGNSFTVEKYTFILANNIKMKSDKSTQCIVIFYTTNIICT